MHAQFYMDKRFVNEWKDYYGKIKVLEEIGLIDKILMYDSTEDAPIFNDMKISHTPTCIIVDDKGEYVWIPYGFEGRSSSDIARWVFKCTHNQWNDVEDEMIEDLENKGVANDYEKNPSYYDRASVSAIDLMAELMNHDQFEGFLWGNILKYAYRYGQKGNKAETAAKIKQYADWLEEEAAD